MKPIETYINPPQNQWHELTRRCERQNLDIENTVASIINEVAHGGDRALKAIVERIDGYSATTFEMSAERRAELATQVPEEVKRAIFAAKENIADFHRAQLPKHIEVETAPGVKCMQRAVPIDKVGIYIPGGKAPLFSTVLMLTVPAKIAGCREVVLCTPCDRLGCVSPEIVFAANICGVDRIFTVGGAQAIAAMAYGTQSIPRVHKIFGPGNRYVTTAKQMVGAQQVAIDMPAGPSEVMVLADDTAVPAFVAADFLSQAEHGDDSQALLVCSSRKIAQAVEKEIGAQLAELHRGGIVAKALDNSRIIVFDTDEGREDMLRFANAYAPEHLIISMSNPWEIAKKVTAAGSVFIGNYSPESAGDYASGTNHTLPTSGWATAYSGVNIDSFMHKITYQELTPQGLNLLSGTIVTMAEAEGLDAHANAVKIRMKGGGR